jgi:hypothetical protein
MTNSTYTIWVCSDCMLHHANGECGNCHTDEGHECEPFNLYHPKDIAMGMSQEEHSCDTRWSDWRERDCGCETDYFSWSACQGCGSTLGGERHAFTVWIEEN